MADRITEIQAGWYAIKLNNMGKYFSDLKIAKLHSVVYLLAGFLQRIEYPMY